MITRIPRNGFYISLFCVLVGGGLATGLFGCDEEDDALQCVITSPADGAEFVIDGGLRVPVETRVRGPVSEVQFHVNDALVATLTAAPYTYEFAAFRQDPGTFTIRATAVTTAGESASDEINLILRRDPDDTLRPVADFEATPRSVAQDSPVQFQDLSDRAPTSWRWDFGDGHTSEEQNPVHAYAAQGMYTVTLTAANEHGEDTEVKVDFLRVNAPLPGLPCPGAETVTDEDGNIYATVQIGDQCWMAENLRVGRFVECLSAADRQTDNGTAEHYRYQNDTQLYDEYGGLYQWDEVMTYDPSDDGHTGSTRGLCPVGWHLPTDEEWKTLERTLGMLDAEVDKPEGEGKWRGTEEAHALRETGTAHWSTDIASTNDSGFTALPGGWRNASSGDFTMLGEQAVFWTATEVPDGWHTAAWVRAIGFTGQIGRFGEDLFTGASVRCAKD